jgi:hypothetical protein
MGTMKRVPDQIGPDPTQQEVVYIEEDEKISVWRQWDMYFCGPESHTKENPVLYTSIYGSMIELTDRGTRWIPQEIKKATCPVIHMTRFMPPYDSILIPMNAINFYGGYAPTVPPPPHEEYSPSTGCCCGVYGLKYDFPPDPTKLDCQVIGIAEIWGKIIPAEHGYRAQYAKIRALVDTPPHWEILEKETVPYIAKYFGVPSLPSMKYAQKEFFL